MRDALWPEWRARHLRKSPPRKNSKTRSKPLKKSYRSFPFIGFPLGTAAWTERKFGRSVRLPFCTWRFRLSAYYALLFFLSAFLHLLFSFVRVFNPSIYALVRVSDSGPMPSTGTSVTPFSGDAP